MKWIAQNRGAYANQWVVGEGDRWIAAEPDGTRPLPPLKQRPSKSVFWSMFYLKIRSRSFQVGKCQ
jgi:hypothetical protein